MASQLFVVGQTMPGLRPALGNDNILDTSIIQFPIRAFMPNWDSMQFNQTLITFLNDQEIDRQPVIMIDVAGIQTGVTQDTTINLTDLVLGENRLRYRVTDSEDATHPNISNSPEYIFTVIQDRAQRFLKIDITEGAAAHSFDFPELMPANIAVIRGEPAPDHETAPRFVARRTGNNVLFQILGGPDHVTFYFDAEGLSPLTLIKNPDLPNRGNFAAGVDTIYITRHDSDVPLISEPVVFGDYVTVTGADAQDFDSYSFNSVGIADGKTTSIFSIKMNPLSKVKTLLVTYPKELTIGGKELNLPINPILNSNSAKIQQFNIFNNMVEFTLKSSTAGDVFPITVGGSGTNSSFTQNISFKELKA